MLADHEVFHMGTCVDLRRADLPGDEFWTVTTLRDAVYKDSRRRDGWFLGRAPSPRPAMHVPNELLSKIAACLPLRDRCQAVYTSRQWRDAFLTTPFVWDHLEFLFYTKNSDGYRNWVALMQLLLKRNAGRPLTLDFEVYPTPTTRPSRAALEHVYDVIALHMPHMKSLSLAIPSAHDLPMFDVHAPILETLRVKIGGMDSDEHMPVTLFAGIAPRLSTLYLRTIDLPRAPCPALRSVENLLFHDENEITDAFVFGVATGFPSLTTLTVTTDDGFTSDGVGLPVFPGTRNVISLRLNVRVGMENMVALFPKAQSIAYSCSSANGRDDSPDATQTVRRTLCAAGHPTSIKIRWAPLHVELPWFFQPDEPTLVIVLDGHKVIVDVVLEAVQAALTVNMMKSLVPRAEKIVVPDELWDAFSRRKLLPELDVTLILRDWTATLGTVYRQQSVSSLTLARASGDENVVLSAALLSAFVQSSLTPNTLRRVVLAGFHTDDPSAFIHLGVDVRLTTLWRDTPDDDLWTWDIAKTALEV